MTLTVERPAGGETGRALKHLECLADNPKHSTSPREIKAFMPISFPSTRARSQRLEAGIERVHALGPRALAEMLAEIVVATGRPDIVADRVEAYAALDPEILRAVGGDRFPPRLMAVVIR